MEFAGSILIAIALYIVGIYIKEAGEKIGAALEKLSPSSEEMTAKPSQD